MCFANNGANYLKQGKAMAADHRIENANGERRDFTCQNRRYMTDVTMGHPHGPAGSARGSVLNAPLFDFGDASIWLEHVVERSGAQEKCFWLMWYDAEGRPTIPLSGVFGAEQLQRAAAALQPFTRPPEHG